MADLVGRKYGKGSGAGMVFVPNPAGIAALAKNNDVAKGVLDATLAVEKEAVNLVPVDTGRLQASIAHDMREDGDGVYGVVGTDVEYAPFVELGARGQQGQPYLVPALNKVLGSRK